MKLIENCRIPTHNQKDMSSQAFLLINLGFAVAVVGIFLLGRMKVRAPSRLSMKYAKRSLSTHGGSASRISDEAQAVSPEGQIKNLNPIFIFNGHSWDAFEVLGLPAGSSMESVQKAYEVMVAKSDEQSKVFFDAALQAIQATRS